MDGENNLMLRPVNWPTLNSVEVFIHRMVKLNCPQLSKNTICNLIQEEAESS